MAPGNHNRVIPVRIDLVARSQMDAAELPAEPVPTLPSTAELTQREREILAFERQWWKYAGAKEQAIRELFDLSPTRYYQLVNRLIEKSAALEAEPMLVKRLRRLRTGRQRVRQAPRLGAERR
jgi:hypothetical protein